MRGQLARAGLGLRTDLDVWLDAVYGLWAEVPFDTLTQMAKRISAKVAQLDPDEARKTWGRRPEHVALAGQLGKGDAPDPADAIQRWEQARGVTAGRRFGAHPIRNPRG